MKLFLSPTPRNHAIRILPLVTLFLCVSANAPGPTMAQETGPNDFEISDTGPPGDPRFDAAHEAIAYNSRADEYLVVWDANVSIAGSGTGFGGKRELFGQRLAADGSKLGDATLLASAGPADSSAWKAENPEVVYDSTQDGYFVVWEQTVATGAAAAKTEIFGGRFTPALSARGPSGRLSFTGSDANLQRDAVEPGLAFSPASNQFFVVWESEESDAGSTAESEIYGQRVNAATGELLGPNVRLSTMGPEGNTRYDAQDPFVTHNASADEFLVLWRGDDDRGGLVDGEFEIFGQRVAATGQPVGPDDFRISRLGPDGNVTYRAEDPTAAFDPDDGHYLVTWTGNDVGTAGEEVYGALVDADGTVERSDFRISSMGPDGDARWDVNETAVRYDPDLGEFVVVWLGEDDRDRLVVNEREVFGQRLDAATGDAVGPDDFRVSDMGPDGANSFDAFSVDLAYNPLAGEFLVVWSGDDDRPPRVAGEVEIYGQRLALGEGCFQEETALCLNGGRFRLQVEWRTTDGRTGAGIAESLSTDTGTFWFFDPANIELVVKVLDARGVNGAFWVFYGALSNVEYRVSVTDTESGAFRTYVNPNGVFASAGDVGAFPRATVRPTGSATTAPVRQTALDPAVVRPVEAGAVGACVADPTTLCLNRGRFEVRAVWEADGKTGAGQATPITSDTGRFWFFDSANVELVLKVLDARGVNGRFWVFYGALSNVAYQVTVRDTETGSVKVYSNPAGTFASVGDTDAF